LLLTAVQTGGIPNRDRERVMAMMGGVS
jgi:hypothetical protein